MKRLTDIAVPIALLSLSGLAVVFVLLPVGAVCKGLELLNAAWSRVVGVRS